MTLVLFLVWYLLPHSKTPHTTLIAVADPGEGTGGPGPLIFRPKWGPKGRKKFFWRPPPLPFSQGPYDCPPLIWRSGSATESSLVANRLAQNQMKQNWYRLTELQFSVVHQGHANALHCRLSLCLSEGRQSRSLRISSKLSTQSAERVCLPPLQLFEHCK